MRFNTSDLNGRGQVSGDGHPPGYQSIRAGAPPRHQPELGSEQGHILRSGEAGFQEADTGEAEGIHHGTAHLGGEGYLLPRRRVGIQGRGAGQTCFIIGDKPQAAEDFKRQIESRFGGRFEEAWKEALELVRSFDEGVLLSQRGFYEQVYRPRRDAFTKRWTKLSRGEP